MLRATIGTKLNMRSDETEKFANEFGSPNKKVSANNKPT